MHNGVRFHSTMLNERTIEMIVSGRPMATDLISFMHSTYPKVSFSHALWNFQAASLSMLDAADFRDIATAGREYAAARGEDRKTGVLVNSTTEMLLARAYSAMTLELRPMALRASTNRQELLDWLGV